MAKSPLKLKYRFIIPTTLIIVMLLFINLLWNYDSQRQQTEKEMRETAKVIAAQLDATWKFIDQNQDIINYDDEGNYDFKGLHCSIVGLSVGKIFSRTTDYEIRYVREVPRNPVNSPDLFELSVLEKFQADRTLLEYGETLDYNGVKAFRYMQPMLVDESCLECHGEPAGEIDPSGYPKDGMKIGDMVGAVSIAVPTSLYDSAAKANLIRDLLFFGLLTLAAAGTIYYFVTKLVTNPLGRLQRAVNQVGGGNMDIDLSGIEATGELSDLAERFDDMATQLKHLYTDLEDKVETRTAQLGQANEILLEQQRQLENSNLRLIEESRYKNDFLAMVSHELKTPLASIMLFLDILASDSIEDANDNKDIIEKAKFNCQRLLSMINNILYLARIEAGKMELSPDTVDMVDVMGAVESLLLPQADARSIELYTSVSRDVPLIFGDYEKLRCILENLMGNALKFTPEGGRVLARVYTEKDEILIKVEDNGIGIKEEDLPQVFDRFVQSDSSTSRPYNGSGLGLALVREFAQLHGGSAEVSSVLGEGSIFTVRLPLEKLKWQEEN